MTVGCLHFLNLFNVIRVSSSIVVGSYAIVRKDKISNSRVILLAWSSLGPLAVFLFMLARRKIRFLIMEKSCSSRFLGYISSYQFKTLFDKFAYRVKDSILSENLCHPGVCMLMCSFCTRCLPRLINRSSSMILIADDLLIEFQLMRFTPTTKSNCLYIYIYGDMPGYQNPWHFVGSMLFCSI